MPTNAVIIRLTASLIEELINQGSIVVDGSLGNVKVRRMFLANDSGVAGEVHIVLEDEGLPRVANYSCQLPYVNAEAQKPTIVRVDDDAFAARLRASKRLVNRH